MIQDITTYHYDEPECVYIYNLKMYLIKATGTYFEYNEIIINDVIENVEIEILELS